MYHIIGSSDINKTWRFIIEKDRVIHRTEAATLKLQSNYEQKGFESYFCLTKVGVDIARRKSTFGK